jgi:hypothetical protein
MPRILGANSFELIQMWVNVAYAGHTDMHSHTGGPMYLGTGVLNSKSTKKLTLCRVAEEEGKPGVE